MAWFLILNMDGRQHCWAFPDENVPDETVERAKALLGFPAGDAWIADPRYEVRLTSMDRPPGVATMHERAELDRVTAEALATYRDSHRAALSQERMAEARAAVQALTDAERASLRDEMPPRGTATTGGR